MQLEIQNDTIKALVVIAAKGDIRYYLNAVCLDVRDNDACLVATDGHRMIAVPVELFAGSSPRKPGQYIIPREILESIKPYKKTPITLAVDTGAASVTVSTGATDVSSKLIDGHYPEWRKVIPLTVSGETGQFDSDYIGSFGKAHKLLGGKYSPGIFHNGTGAARISLAGNAVGVLMPLRVDIPESLENPDFILPPGQQELADAA
jgi:DNA polymerase III subunit beta